jgi:hypothetical protein
MHVRWANSDRRLIVPLGTAGWPAEARRHRATTDTSQPEFHTAAHPSADPTLDHQPVRVLDRERYTNELEDLHRSDTIIPYTGVRRPDNTMVYYPGLGATTDASGHRFRDDHEAATLDSYRIPQLRGQLALDTAIIVPANGRRPGLSRSYPKRLRWVTRHLDMHEQLAGIPEAQGALKMIDLTLSPDEKNLVGYANEAIRFFEGHRVDPSHVKALFHIGGQMTVYRGPKTDQFCNMLRDEDRQAFFHQLEESREHHTAIATWNDDENCNGHSVIRFNIPIDIRPLLAQASDSTEIPAPAGGSHP